MSSVRGRIKAVLFDVGGVLVPQPQKAIARYENELGLRKRFLSELFLEGESYSAFCRLERGLLTVSEFCKEFDVAVRSKAHLENAPLPVNFSTLRLMQAFQAHTTGKKADFALLFQQSVNKQMLNAAKRLRKQNIRTCVLTNNWIDDIESSKGRNCRFMATLGLFFDEVVQSALIGMRKPSPEIYTYACRKLGVAPHETAFLDDLGVNLKSASQLGIKCIKVDDTARSLKELEKLCGVDLLFPAEDMVFPPPATPDKVCHSYAQVNEKMRLHFVDVGEGPVVLLLHGFPDCWYGWRYQIAALAFAGYRVIALDMPGYGESSAPAAIDEYSHKKVSEDILSLLDMLCIPQAVVVGHDWGGSLAWYLALVYPHRFKGVCGVNTPFFPINPNKNPLESMYKRPGVFDYQLYFQEPGVAEKELEKNMKKTFSVILQGVPKENEKRVWNALASTSNVRKRGGFLAGIPDDIPISSYLSEADIAYYIEQFKKNGFRGPLNWYRNYEANWKWLSPFSERKITIPALMVTASHDSVLKPEYSYGMEKTVTNLTRLHINRCSHWTPQEKPDELSRGIVNWLEMISAAPQAKL